MQPNSSMIKLVAALASSALAACGVTRGTVEFQPARETISVVGLGPCDSDPTATVRLDSTRPLVLLVHGCNSSAGRFRTLAQVFEHQGQQTICFSYDDRDRLETSARQLREALAALEARLAVPQITVLGHSQGGLVARRALALGAEKGEAASGLEVRLVTVSSPFAGIESSSHCGSVLAHVLSLGITTGICQLVAGAKWTEIPPGSRLVRAPGTLRPQVREHLRVATDERDSCRTRAPDGACVQDDYVFSLGEQQSEPVDSDARVSGVEVKAGHVEIVGETGEPPHKLIRLLEERGILARIPAGKRRAFAALLVQLYGEESAVRGR